MSGVKVERHLADILAIDVAVMDDVEAGALAWLAGIAPSARRQF